jgi:glycosyltransferase involved in cell wall biosynthesis
MSRPKILISAFSCHPQRGSEPGVGHFFVSELARHCDLTVITEEVENRAAIERHQRQDSTYASIDFQFIKWPWLDGEGRRIDDRGSFHFYRCLHEWEMRAAKLATALSAVRRFDLTHHLTMQGYREPGYLWRLPLPFVWGPVGGHAQIPWRYLPTLGWRGMFKQGLRNIGNVAQSRLHPRVRAAAKAASAVITNTSAERDAFARLYGVRATVIGEFGAEAMNLPPRRAMAGRPIKIAWSGVHVPRKALPILLRAMAQLPPGVRAEAHILADGPETERWQRLARDLGVSECCIWHGRLPRRHAIEVMSGCDVFALTSLLDGTSCVLNEAIAVGLPVICHRACGFADIVDESCGILIEPSSPRQSVAGFAGAIAVLASDATRYQSLCDGARRRIEGISVQRRARQMLEVYERALGREIVSVTPASPTPQAATALVGAGVG